MTRISATSTTEFEGIINEFLSQLDEVYGMYLDSTEGLKLLLQDRKATHERFGTDNLELQYIYAEEHDDFQPIQHKISYNDFVARNEALGLNPTLLAQSCIVLIYGYWEDLYRQKIADILKLGNKNEVVIPFMNELRCMRRDIVHHRGLITADTSKKLSFDTTEGSRIEFLGGEFFELVLTVRTSICEYRDKILIQLNTQSQSGKSDMFK